MDSEPTNLLVSLLSISTLNESLVIIGLSLFLLLLILCSAMISGSEIAFFSLSQKDIDVLEEEESQIAEEISLLIGKNEPHPTNGTLKRKEKKLLATILIVNNFINIAIVIVSDTFIKMLMGEPLLLRWGSTIAELFNITYFEPLAIGNFINFLLTVIGVTFILVLFGEVIPKIYANVNNIHFASIMVGPLTYLNKWFSPLSSLLTNSTDVIEKKWANKMSGRSISKEHIDKAIDLTVDNNNNYNKDDVEILKGIVKFNEVSIKEIMRPRVDIVSIDLETTYVELLKIIRSSGHSRIPVYKEDIDNTVGILYVKDLIGKKDEPDFNWQSIIKEDVLYTPETKKIKEQLKEFQLKKVHLAIVVDEYGGCAGLITLEDIMEEIIGEISDEFDSDRSIDYIKVNKNNYFFEGKTSLHDVAKVLNIDSDIFDDFKGEADSIAGLLLEVNGILPPELAEFSIENLKIIVIKVNNRRIVKVQIKIDEQIKK